MSGELRRTLTGRAVSVAPRLLGAVITSRVGGAPVSVRLTEVEAYEGVDDPASHAFRGRTRRTAVMFGRPGHLYCYFTYGMHWCANVVCGPDGTAAAVLLRAGEVVEGEGVAFARRPAARRAADLARGPARLAACLALGAAQNGVDLLADGADVELAGVARRRPSALATGPRVGITAAAQRPWRFWIPDAPSVSAYRAGGRKQRTAGTADWPA